MPLAFVVDPASAAPPSTLKVTVVAPTTAVPPLVRVSVADNVTGPALPSAIDAGLGAAKVSVVGTVVAALTVTTGEVPISVSVPPLTFVFVVNVDGPSVLGAVTALPPPP